MSLSRLLISATHRFATPIGTRRDPSGSRRSALGSRTQKLGQPIPLLPHRASWRGQFFHTLFGRCLFQISVFLSAIVIARDLGPVGQGKYHLLLTLVAFTSLFIKLGLDQALVYLLPRATRSGNNAATSLVSYSLVLTFLLAVLLALLTVLLSTTLERYVFRLPDFSHDLQFFPALLPSLVLLTTTLAVLQGLGRAEVRAYIYYYGVGFSFLGSIFLLHFFSLTNGSVYLARTFTFLLGAILALAVIIRVLPVGRFTLSRHDLLSLHSLSGLLILSGAFEYVVEQPLVDLIILSNFATPQDLGVYSVAAKLALLTGLISGSFHLVLGPAFAESFAEQKERVLKKVYMKASSQMALLCVSSVLGVYLVRHELLALFGNEYVSGAPILVTLLLAVLIVGLLGPNSALLLAAGFARLDFLFTTLSALAMCLTAPVLGYRFGTGGVAASTALSLTLLALLRHLAARRLLKVTPLRTTVRHLGLGLAALTASVLASRLLATTGLTATLLPLFIFLTVMASWTVLASKVLRPRFGSLPVR